MSRQYSEPDDFREHEEHIDRMFNALGDIEISPTALVLDVGGGQGMHACYLAQRYAVCYCLDVIDYKSLYGSEFNRLFKEKCERNDVMFEEQQLRFVQSDAMDMALHDNYFDFVTSFNALEHIPDPLRALQEMIRVTKKGGIIYLSFDPIWTADTGSHFIHRVPEPWAHLVNSQDEFVSKMQAAGASDDEIADFKSGMNQCRLSYYRGTFEKIVARHDVELLRENSWSGLVDASYREHPNYAKCIQMGYTEEELNFRGMQFIFRKK